MGRARLFVIALLCLIFHEFHLRRQTVAAHFPKHRDRRKLQGIGSSLSFWLARAPTLGWARPATCSTE